MFHIIIGTIQSIKNLLITYLIKTSSVHKEAYNLFIKGIRLFLFFLKIFIYIFFTERGRKGEKDVREKH